jgi:UPF0716 protein FxsA
MVVKLFLLFTIIPALEIYLIVKVGGLLGIIPTILLLLAISSVGAMLVRQQGFSLLGRIQSELAGGRVPGGTLLEGALVLAGGVLLLTPGFFTDFLGLFFLIPSTRTVIARLAVSWLQWQFLRGKIIARRV